MCRYGLTAYKPHYVCFRCRKSFKQPILSDILERNSDLDDYRKAYDHYRKKKAQQFRENHPELIQRFEEQYHNRIIKCPHCANEMHPMGMDFRAPKKEKIKEWRIAEGMYKVGHAFQTCGCDGPGFIPTKHADYLKYLEDTESEYKQRRNDRPEYISQEELPEHIAYWEDKLNRVRQELSIARNASS